jgi:predicted anti-sigma-YlaC factor YlaD
VNCERIREAASARLDGEAPGVPSARIDEHLAECPACRRWLADIHALARATRISREAVPDLTDRILLDVARPATRLWRRQRWLRAALALVGTAQLAVAAPALFGDSMGMAMAMHSAHESAAWNAALGLAFLATAIRPRRAAGLLPMLVSLVAILAVLGGRDLAAGAVGLGRLATHLGCAAGLVVVAALARQRPLSGPSPAREALRDERADHPGLRGVA